MKQRIIVFDAYGTLFDVYSIGHIANELFPGKGEAVIRLWRQKQLEYSFLRHIMNRYDTFFIVTKEALQYACKALHIPISPVQERELLESYLRLQPYPETEHVLSNLTDSRLAILSNGSPDMLHPLLHHTGMTPYFHHVISVDEIQQYKPCPNVYDLACKHFQAGKEDILFVSANGWDVSGAKHFGFQVAWINRANMPMDNLGAQPDYILRDLHGLLML